MEIKCCEDSRLGSRVWNVFAVFCVTLTFATGGCRQAIEEPALKNTPESVSDVHNDKTTNAQTAADEPEANDNLSVQNARAARMTVAVPAQQEKTQAEMETASTDQEKQAVEQDHAEQERIEQNSNEEFVEPVFPQELVNPKWKRMDPNAELWIDFENKLVVVGGRICFREGYLEMFACPAGTKEHESVVAVNSSSRMVHACLLALGANPGTTVAWDPEYKPASGPVIDIDVHWIADGKEVVQKARDMVLDMNTLKPMTHEWVFGGSREFTDPVTKATFYAGDGGEFICLSNFTTATIDIPVPSSDSVGQLMFAANSEKIPELGHRVLMFMKPRLEEKSDEAAEEKKAGDTK